MESGRRRDMVLRVGLRRTSLVRLAEDQSRYSVESAVAQKFRSWSSVLNAGSFFLVTFKDKDFARTSTAILNQSSALVRRSRRALEPIARPYAFPHTWAIDHALGKRAI